MSTANCESAGMAIAIVVLVKVVARAMMSLILIAIKLRPFLLDVDVILIRFVSDFKFFTEKSL